MKAFTLHRLQVVREDGGFDVHAPGAVIELDAKLFADFKARGAVRAPNERELARHELTRPRDPLDHDGDGRKGGFAPTPEPALSAKHKGGGKWTVVNSDDEVVSGENLFDSREAAEEWIAEQAASLRPSDED